MNSPIALCLSFHSCLFVLCPNASVHTEVVQNLLFFLQVSHQTFCLCFCFCVISLLSLILFGCFSWCCFCTTCSWGLWRSWYRNSWYRRRLAKGSRASRRTNWNRWRWMYPYHFLLSIWLLYSFFIWWMMWCWSYHINYCICNINSCHGSIKSKLC